MTKRTIHGLAALGLVAALTLGCAYLGIGQQGNKFNYEAAAQLKKGMSMEQVKSLLEGEPRATGRQMHTGYTHWHYEYAKTAGVGAGLPLVGGSMSKGQAYQADVYFNDGKVVDFNYFTNELGSEGATL